MIDSRFTDLTAHLWRGGKYAYFWTPNDGTGQKTSYWLTVGGDTTVPKWLEGLDAYFSVNPANIRRCEHERARIIGSFDIAAINCLYTEFDGTDRAELDAFLAKLLTFGVKAACIIFSGGGYHVYVLLRAPFVLDSRRQTKAGGGSAMGLCRVGRWR
jgi:hypothetical protein